MQIIFLGSSLSSHYGHVHSLYLVGSFPVPVPLALSRLSIMVVVIQPAGLPHPHPSLFCHVLLWPILSYHFLSSFSMVASADEG